jgi:hypothetical protein
MSQRTMSNTWLPYLLAGRYALARRVGADQQRRRGPGLREGAQRLWPLVSNCGEPDVESPCGIQQVIEHNRAWIAARTQRQLERRRGE